MKSNFTLLTLLISVLTFAQQGINYKALIKDDSGNVIANDLIIVQFQILQGAGMTNVYQESHTPTTDANGLIIVNIGEGTPISGTFASINWASDTSFLNTQINTGAGLVNMGTTEFKTVPYAKNAETAKVAENVTGLEAIDEGNGVGWRLKGRNPNNYGNIGENAVNMSYSFISSGTDGATGNYSISMGANTTASGLNSAAMGYRTTSSGDTSTAMGFYSTSSGDTSTVMGNYTAASGSYTTAMGSFTTASGHYSTSMGQYTNASSYNSLAIGRYNVGGGTGTSWIATDRLFEVGNGTSTANKSNALTILKNGKVGIGTATPSSRFQITNGLDASYSSDSGYMVLGSTSGSNLVFDDNEIIARNNGANSTLFLQQDGGDVRVGGVVVHSSDFRLKKDIIPLTYGLETILELNPVEYNWKNREQEYKSLGLIAQEVQPVIKNIVHTADDEDKTLSVSYTELIPVLINAVKDLKAENDVLRSRVEVLENNNKHL